MAKVSLRIYNREIESLIDQSHNNEAIAHCHHILRTFPKHLATYRLLGKALLELKRRGEAVDVFTRVLMSTPDDFVSHVGMSIIRDEEQKTDDAIWHMERAFETQPSNGAIQGELQRLYGRRDGMEPPKVRMTRGALAHMYVQGELYPQAIAEIRAVLALEPERTDMQVLLARAYFRGGQKADASDMCAQLLKRYQFCLDANRIMVDLLPSTAGVESTQVYRMRVGELDPYATFARGSVFLSHEVPDAAISLERLDYKEENEPAAQSWSPSLGSGAAAAPMLAAAASSAMEPDWLRAGSFSDNSSSQPATSASDAGNEIPDFLRQAGWGTSTSPEQPTSIFDEEPGGDLTPAEIPDWLKGQEPVVSAPTPAPQPDPMQNMDMPDWLIDNTQASEPAPGNVPDWLKEASQPAAEPAQFDQTAAWLTELDEKQTAKPAQTESNTPDWLSGLDDKQEAEPIKAESNTPDWLSGLDDKQVAESANIPDWLNGLDDEQEIAPAKAESNTPDWLSGLDDKQTAEPANVPDWLSGLDEEQQAEPAQAKSNVPDWLSGLDDQAAVPAEIPDWLSEPKPQATPTVESLGSTAQEQDDAVAWLESLAAKHGAKPEELVTDPNKRNETPPNWVSQAQNLNQDTPAPSASVESLGSSAQEQDDAVAWLESLAAKHGAKPEELVTDPNKRSETPPDWVSQAQNLNQETPASAASVESLGSSAQEQDDAVAWLESLAAKHGAKPEELVTDPNKRSETPPNWVSQAQNLNQETPAASVESLGASVAEQDDAVAWLESLAAKHGAKPEELVTDPNKRSETPPNWVSQAQSIGEAQSAEAEKPEVVENALNIGEQFFAEFESASTSTASVESLGSTAQEQDDAVAWLESLAAKHGAKPEELVTDPNKRSETPPSWVSQAQSIGEAQSAEAEQKSEAVENALNIGEQFFAEFENASTAPPVDETKAWLQSLDEEDEKKTQAAEASKDTFDWFEESKPEPLPRAEIPEWLSDSQPQNSEEQFKFAEQEAAPQKSDLPNWLSDIEKDEEVPQEEVSHAMPENDLANWLNSLDDEPGLPFDAVSTPDSILFASQAKPGKSSPNVSIRKEPEQPDWLSDADDVQGAEVESAPVKQEESLPDWLKATDEETDLVYEDDDTPPWQHRERWEAEGEPQHPTPTAPSDWHPLEPKQVEEKSAPKQEAPVVEAHKPFVPPPPQPVAAAQPVAVTPTPPAPVKKKPGLSKKQPEGANVIVALNQAKNELDRGDIPAALAHYGKLIKKGKHIEETIRDLTESIYRYPVEVGIWQTLGDAYMRGNRLKEALEAYNKAEELIR